MLLQPALHGDPHTRNSQVRDPETPELRTLKPLQRPELQTLKRLQWILEGGCHIRPGGGRAHLPLQSRGGKCGDRGRHMGQRLRWCDWEYAAIAAGMLLPLHTFCLHDPYGFRVSQGLGFSGERGVISCPVDCAGASAGWRPSVQRETLNKMPPLSQPTTPNTEHRTPSLKRKKEKHQTPDTKHQTRTRNPKP